MINRRLGPVIPAPNSMAPISHAGSRGVKQRPIDGPADTFWGVRLFGLVAEMVLVGWLKIDEGPVREVGPIIGQWAIRKPLECVIIIAMAALITNDVIPLFVFEFLPNPLHAARV